MPAGNIRSNDWTLIDTSEFLDDCAHAWDALNLRLYRSHPLFDSRFLFPLLKWSSSRKLKVYRLGSAAQARGFVLLEPRRLGVWQNFQRSQAEISPVMLAPADAQALPSLFASLPPHVQLIDFRRQDPAYSPWDAIGHDLARRTEAYLRTANIAIEGAFDDYWSARPRRLRHSISRSLRRAADQGASMTLRVVEDAKDIQQAIDEFGLLESRGWKAALGTAVAPHNDQGRFYREVFTSFARTGQAISYQLIHGSSVIAHEIALAGNDALVLIKTTYDETYRAFSPGRVIDHELLKYEFDRRRFRTVELNTNADTLQLRWASASRPISDVRCFRSGLARQVYEWRTRWRTRSTDADAANTPTDRVDSKQADRNDGASTHPA